MDEGNRIKISELFNGWANQPPQRIDALPVSGSSRQYFRLSAGSKSVIAAWNEDVAENEAFFYLTRHFLGKSLPVPEVLAVSGDRKSYLLTDLGDTRLFDILKTSQDEPSYPLNVSSYYRDVISDLLVFQFVGREGLDFEQCFPVPSFDAKAIAWDLNYFKYYFLKLSGTAFNEAQLEKAFRALTEQIIDQPGDYFMYRDFQSRNIMLHDGKRYYIDYQGGRKGPLTYDLASLLFNTKASLTPSFREKMLGYYIEMARPYTALDPGQFRNEFYTMALVRVLQAMGAYGFRGYFERKALFLSGIPLGINNLAWLLGNTEIDLDPYLRDILMQLTNSKQLQRLGEERLTVTINSFSYRQGIPGDPSGNGGGYVFDCRALPNPGREPQYQDLTGKDEAVMDYLAGMPEVEEFIESTASLVSRSVNTYLERGFSNLSVSYGCTGGQHRSVYCAERLADRLKGVAGVIVRLRHLRQGDL